MKNRTTTQRPTTRWLLAATMITTAIALSIVVAPPVTAATFTWDGGGANNLWITPNNWDPNAYDPNGSPGNGTGTNFVFAVGTRPSITLTDGHNPNTNNLLVNTATSRTFTLDGTTGNTRIEFQPVSNGDETITISSGTHEIATINTTATSGIVRLQGSDRQEWRVSGGAQLTISAPIDMTSTNRGFTKRGSGTLVLTNAANSFGGAVIAGDGDLRFSSIANSGTASALGTGGGTARIQIGIPTVGGAMLTYTGADASTNRQVFIQRRDTGAGGTGTLTSTTNALTLTGGITVDTDVASGAGIYDLSIGGNGGINVNTVGITGATGLTKIGNGTVAINANSSYAGTTTISAGTLRIGSAGTTGTLGAGNVTNNASLAFNRSNNLTVSNVIGGTGTLEQAGAGRLTLSGNNDYSGVTTVNNGQLRLTHVNALGSTVGGTTVSGGGTTATSRIELLGDLVYAAETLTLAGRIFGDNPTAHVQNVSGSNTWTGDILFAAGGSRFIIESVAGHLLITGNVTNSTTTARVLRLNGAADGEISGVISHTAPTVANFTAVEKQGAGVWTLSGNNSYTGFTNVQEGTLRVNGTHTGGGLYTVSSGATLGGTGSIAADILVNAGGILAPGASIESLVVTGAVTLNGQLAIEVGGGLVDLLAISGSFDITNASVDFSEVGALGDAAYVFATYGSLIGSQFATVIDLPTNYAIDYAYQGSQIALVLQNIEAIPAPAALPAGLALLALAAARRRRAAR